MKNTRTRRARFAAVAAAGTLAAGAALAGTAQAAVTVDTQELRDAVTVAGVTEHLEVFQDIADANDDNRQAGTAGHDLLRSEYYVSQLTKRQIKDTALNRNFDMVGSPNAVNFVYDGDGDALGVSGPNGSGLIEDVFTDFFTSEGEASEPTDFDGRSDYFAFINAGIPAGGLFTGAEGIKTAEQAATYGGTAGVAFDPCYHSACDTIDNIAPQTLDIMADAIAHATLTFAETTSAVNGTSRGAGTGRIEWEYKGNHALR